MKLLEMEKDMKGKQSLSSPLYKVWGTFFCRKALLGGTNFFGQSYGGSFTWGLTTDHASGKVNG